MRHRAILIGHSLVREFVLFRALVVDVLVDVVVFVVIVVVTVSDPFGQGRI